VKLRARLILYRRTVQECSSTPACFRGGKKSEARNRLPAGVNLKKLDAVLLTHAHLDHTGRVPLLVKHDFAGRIFATNATIALAELIL
jgi:metallo-beta-lactamase family protein